MKRSSKILITAFSLFTILFNIVFGGYTSLASAAECGATYTVDNATNTITLNKPTETGQTQTETLVSCIQQELNHLGDNITINLNGQKIVYGGGDFLSFVNGEAITINDEPEVGVTTEGEFNDVIAITSNLGEDADTTTSLTINGGIFRNEGGSGIFPASIVLVNPAELIINGGTFDYSGPSPIYFSIMVQGEMTGLPGAVSLDGVSISGGTFLDPITFVSALEDGADADRLFSGILTSGHDLCLANDINTIVTNKVNKQSIGDSYGWGSESPITVCTSRSDDEEDTNTDEDSIVSVPDTGAATKTTNDRVLSSTVVVSILVGVVVAMTSAYVLIKK